MLKRLLFVLLLLAPTPALAQSLAGAWALRLDGAVIFRFELEPEGEGWSGTWTRPRS